LWDDVWVVWGVIGGRLLVVEFLNCLGLWLWSGFGVVVCWSEGVFIFVCIDFICCCYGYFGCGYGGVWVFGRILGAFAVGVIAWGFVCICCWGGGWGLNFGGGGDWGGGSWGVGLYCAERCVLFEIVWRGFFWVGFGFLFGFALWRYGWGGLWFSWGGGFM